ncbi:N-formylglutamate amidohydrolase, partial [Agrobacterium pusense]
SRAALHFLEELGFVAVCNKPYAGGFITEHYGRPIRSLHALQIEVNRSLYVDEKTLLKKGDFPAIQASLEIFMRQLGAFVSEYAIETSLAAE